MQLYIKILNPLCNIAAWTNVYDVGDFDTASRILIADIFAKKKSKDRGE